MHFCLAAHGIAVGLGGDMHNFEKSDDGLPGIDCFQHRQVSRQNSRMPDASSFRSAAMAVSLTAV